jgi:ligand-binding sensor domain-containing protein
MPFFLKPGFSKNLFLCCLFLITQQAKTQTIPINFRHYSLADGLSSYKVVKVLQDRFGFMWIATQDGLNRFDGKGMIIYNKSARERHLLAGSDITDILEDTARNILWVISSYGGLNGIDLKTGNVKYTITVADSASRFNHGWLKCMTLYKDELWIGTFDGIAIYDPYEGRFKKRVGIPLKKSNDYNYDFDVNLFFKDEYERIWAFIANYGLVIYSGADHSVVSFHNLSALGLQGKYEFKQFNSSRKIGEGQMLLATWLGIKKISYDGKGSLKIEDQKIPGTAGKEIRALEVDREGKLWFATSTGLFTFSLQDGDFSAIKDVNQADQKKWLSSINSVFVDNHDNLWLGTLQGFALATSRHAVFLNYYQSADLKVKINRAYFIFPLSDSSEYYVPTTVFT